jgi:hypothetical protein
MILSRTAIATVDFIGLEEYLIPSSHPKARSAEGRGNEMTNESQIV